MLTSRSYYLDEGDYAPSQASYYTFGGTVPNPRYNLARRLQTLRNLPKTEDVSSANFQRFLTMQNDPAAFAMSKIKLPNTPLGNLASFITAQDSLPEG